MEEILIIDDSEQIGRLLANFVLPDLGYRAHIARTGRAGLQRLRSHLPDLILLDLQLPDIDGLDLLRLFAQEGFDVPVILMTAHGSELAAVEAFRLGARNYLIKPFTDSEARGAIDEALRERRLRREKEQLTATLQQRIQELTVLARIGKSVTGLMDQEQLLDRIIEASVYVTQAEEGFLLLRDAAQEELYLRAARNVGEARASRLRMPIADTLAGQVVRSGRPLRLSQAAGDERLQIAPGFHVRATLQVPLQVGERVIGVLAVDNRQASRTFSEGDQYLLAALADYAAIAIENARLYGAARLSEERYRAIFSNASDMVIMLDPELKITGINRSGAQMLGYESGALIGRAIWSLCAPETWPTVERTLRGLLAGTAGPPFPLELIRRDEESVFLEVSAQLIQLGDQPPAISCIARDLTERRRLEQQLIQSDKLSAIGQLVAGVAHELNNPLTSVSGYAQFLLRDSSLPAETRSDVEQIHLQAERAGRIVRNLLVFAREHKPERMAVQINEVLRSTLALQAYQLRVDNIAVAQELAEDLPLTVADPHQLQQVFLNLITNARQAMAGDGARGTLTLRSRVVDLPAPSVAGNGAGSRQIEVMVGDTGVGISERNLAKIFNPFFTTKPVGQGTGLGLSICYGIIQEHQGRIWVESQIGVGTQIFVSLPIHAPELSDQAGAGAPAHEAGPHYRILVVDDEEPVLRLMQRLLVDLGHEVATAAGAEAALAAIDRAHYDVLLTDIKMPGWSGFDLVDAVRLRAPDLAERVIFTTGDTLSEATTLQIEQIADRLLPKPFSLGQLAGLLRNLPRRRIIGSHRA